MRRYFQAHPISIVSSFTLGSILRNREAIGRIAERAMELAEFELQFVSTKTIKSRALAEFIAEWTPVPDDMEEEETTAPAQRDERDWVLHFDGSFTLEGAGAGVLLTSPEGDKLRCTV